jgi:hypothetical protein
MKRNPGWWGLALVLLAASVVAAGEPGQGSFEVVLLSLKSDWQAMRYHAQTGQAWYAFQGDWKPVPESAESGPPEGEYQVLLTATGEHDWVALRLERKSGRSWRLAALKWIEMKVLPEHVPAAAP